MIAFVTLPENLVFASALALMLLIGAAELAGLSGAAEIDADAHGGDLLGWLGLGRVPLSILLVLFLAIFGAVGLVGQQIAADRLGGPLSAWIAGPLAGVAALPLTGMAARLLGPLLPRDETTAIDLDDLVGRQATVVTGTAAAGSPARARAADRHGQAHFVMVEPDGPTERFAEGDAVLLVRREGHGFRAIGRGDARLPRLDY